MRHRCYHHKMKNHVFTALDSRQTAQWGKYLNSIGWDTYQVGKTHIYLKKLRFPRVSFVKVQHPQGPIPFVDIDSIAQKNNALWTLIEPHIAGFSENDYKEYGYEKSTVFQTHSATIKIDLTQNTISLFRSFSENARRNIKKAQKEKIDVKIFFMKEKKNWKYFDIFYSLLTNLGKMKKFYIPSYSEYRKKMTAFKDTSILMFAYEKGEPIAVVWYAYFDTVLAYFQTGITTRGYMTLANYLLVWEGLLLGKKLGLHVFDFESIYDERFPKQVPKYKNYTEFKKRFHGETVLYPQPWIKTHSLFGKLLYKLGT